MQKNVEQVMMELERATNAAFALARSLMLTIEVRDSVDEDWVRIPAPKAKCRVSNWSRSTILRYIEEGHIRGKRLRGARFYSLRDMRVYLRSATEEG